MVGLSVPGTLTENIFHFSSLFKSSSQKFLEEFFKKKKKRGGEEENVCILYTGLNILANKVDEL